MTLDKTLKAIEKRYGKGAIKKLNEVVDVAKFSTGVLSLDYVFGGGVPYGRVVEIFGKESAGKSTTLLHLAAQVQKQGQMAAIVDLEQSVDPEWAQKIGVNLDALYLAQPDSGEEAWSIVEMLIESDAFGLVALDSVAAVTPMREVEGEIGEQHVGRSAQLNTQAMRRIPPKLANKQCTLVLTNQMRARIGAMAFGPTTDTPGGWAIKHTPSVRIQVTRVGNKKNKGEVIAIKSKFECKKNKVGPPFRKVEIEIGYGVGLDAVGDLITWGLETDLVKKSGTWYTIKIPDPETGELVERKAYKKDLRDLLLANPTAYDWLYTQVQKQVPALTT